MQTKTEAPSFVPLETSGLTLADDAQDIRGRTVIDGNGREIGKVKSLLIDEQEQHVRFLELESGGLLGFGAQTRLIPVDAVTDVMNEWVRVDSTQEQIQGTPIYDPELTDAARYFDDLYGHYGYPPYWYPR